MILIRLIFDRTLTKIDKAKALAKNLPKYKNTEKNLDKILKALTEPIAIFVVENPTPKKIEVNLVKNTEDPDCKDISSLIHHLLLVGFQLLYF